MAKDIYVSLQSSSEINTRKTSLTNTKKLFPEFFLIINIVCVKLELALVNLRHLVCHIERTQLIHMLPQLLCQMGIY